MRVFLPAVILCAMIGVGWCADRSVAQAPDRIATANVRPTIAQQPKFTFILFWKENNPTTLGLSESLKSAVAARTDRAECVSVNVSDAANRATVEKYQVDRAPMPLVLCVAPNGAITGVITRQFSEEAVDRALVTPIMADAAKALQDKRIVVVHVKPNAQSPLPAGAADFIADPAFQTRTTLLEFVVADAAENRFLQDMEIRAADVSGSLVVVLAPPGMLVGKFPANATREQIAAALHAAGKCCDDPNCKHNHKGN